MSKNYHLGVSIVFALLALLNIGVGIVFFSGTSVINFLIGAYIGFRSYEEYRVYSENS